MRYIVTGLLFFISFGTFAQDSKSLEAAVVELDQSLIKKDTVALKRLMSDALSYGHSNGWVESKKEVIADLYNGKLTYTGTTRDLQGILIDGATASVRLIDEVEVVLEGKPLKLKLKVLQVWIWKNKRWQLFARQSTKI